MPIPFAHHTLSRFRGSPVEEIFAIGDVHGRSDLLAAALDQIGDIETVDGMPRRVVLLGDLVDRGHDSLGCLDLAIGASDLLGCAVTTLRGNHEQMLTLAVDDALPLPTRLGMLDLWVGNGGAKVVEELFGGTVDPQRLDPDVLREGLGSDRVRFLTDLPGHYMAPEGDILYVHAGVSPWVKLKEFLAAPAEALASPRFSEDHHWCWIREPFLEHSPARHRKVGHHGKFVVHGHTPMDGIRRSPAEHVMLDRLNLDTYAVKSGVLRYARFVGRRLEIREIHRDTVEGR